MYFSFITSKKKNYVFKIKGEDGTKGSAGKGGAKGYRGRPVRSYDQVLNNYN